MTDRPPSWLITGVVLTEEPDEARRVAPRAEAAEVLVLAGLQPAAGRTARAVGTHRHRSQVQSRVTAVAADDRPPFHVACHLLTLRPAGRPRHGQVRLGPRPHGRA